MAKENPTSTAASATAPLFALARTVLDEIDQQAERWLAYGTAQNKEAVELARTLRAQSLGITRTMLGTVESVTTGMLDSAASFGKGIA